MVGVVVCSDLLQPRGLHEVEVVKVDHLAKLNQKLCDRAGRTASHVSFGRGCGRSVVLYFGSVVCALGKVLFEGKVAVWFSWKRWWGPRLSSEGLTITMTEFGTCGKSRSHFNVCCHMLLANDVIPKGSSCTWQLASQSASLCINNIFQSFPEQAVDS